MVCEDEGKFFGKTSPSQTDARNFPLAGGFRKLGRSVNIFHRLILYRVTGQDVAQEMEGN